MRVHVEKNELVVELSERIDASNAGAVEDEIREAIRLHPGQPLCLDARKLTYISSAGLRIMIKLRKELGPGLTVCNVSSEVYDIFDTTGMNLIITIRKRMREISIDGCEVIGKGASGTVYRLDEETVVKIYNGGEEILPVIENDQRNAKQAFVCGIPTAIPFGIVRAGDRYGAVYEMIDARNLNEIVSEDPAALSWVIPKYAELIRSLHENEAHESQLPSVLDRYMETLDAAAPLLSEKTGMKIREFLRNIPENRHVIHGDIQLKNVMFSNGEMVLIDLDTLCTGNPVFEFAALFATYIAFNEVDPLNTTEFLGIDKDTGARIFHETLREYLRISGGENFREGRGEAGNGGGPGEAGTGEDSGEAVSAEDRLREAEKKIRIAGYLRFLTILLIEKKDERSEKKERYIRHAEEQLEKLVNVVDK